MQVFNPLFDLSRIRSEAACDYLIRTLMIIVRDLEFQRDNIKRLRRNAQPVDDKYPVVWAAQRALLCQIHGGDGASECRKLAAQLLVNERHVIDYFQRKLRAHDVDRRKKRDKLIRKWARQGLNPTIIARRLNQSGIKISRPRVANIVRETAI